jgi:hypothetical protein
VSASRVIFGVIFGVIFVKNPEKLTVHPQTIHDDIVCQ